MVSDDHHKNVYKSQLAFRKFYGEFDPGSGRTLAARLTHASRTELLGILRNENELSGERVSNT